MTLLGDLGWHFVGRFLFGTFYGNKIPKINRVFCPFPTGHVVNNHEPPKPFKKNEGFSHLKTRLVTIKTSKKIGLRGQWKKNGQQKDGFYPYNPKYQRAAIGKKNRWYTPRTMPHLEIFTSKPSKSHRMTKGIAIFTTFSWLLWVKIGKYTLHWSYQNPKSKIVLFLSTGWGCSFQLWRYTFQPPSSLARNNQKKRPLHDEQKNLPRYVFLSCFNSKMGRRLMVWAWKARKFAGFAKEKHLQVQFLGFGHQIPCCWKNLTQSGCFCFWMMFFVASLLYL